MSNVIGRLLVWSVVLVGAFVWDYHHQRRPDTPPWARTVRRWRMIGGGAFGLAAIWLTLASGGLTRQGELQMGPPLRPVPWWLERPILKMPPPEAAAFHRALSAGSMVVITCTILLNLKLRSRARTARSDELTSGSSVEEIPDQG
jgi:heme A synthase